MVKNKIYLVKRTDEIGYDEYVEKVVCAKDKQEAREIAADNYADEGRVVWIDERTKVEEVKLIKSRIISESFNAG